MAGHVNGDSGTCEDSYSGICEDRYLLWIMGETALLRVNGVVFLRVVGDALERQLPPPVMTLIFPHSSV